MATNPEQRSYNFVKALEFTLPHEVGIDPKTKQLRADGGLHYKDGNLPTKWGIWAGANPGVDVANLTLDQASEIYRDKYWTWYMLQHNAQGIYANLDAMEIGAAVSLFDTGVNVGVERAWQWFMPLLKEEDPVSPFLEKRRVFYQSKKPNPNVPGWINRVNDLSKYVAILRQQHP